MNEILANVIGAIVTLVIIPLIGLGGKALINLITEKVKNERLARALATATNIVCESVEMIAQTYVDELKAAGTFDQTKQAEAFSKALDNAKTLLSSETKQIVTETYTDLDKWLATEIEAYIQKSKAN
jgi:ribosome-binding factor A